MKAHFGIALVCGLCPTILSIRGAPTTGLDRDAESLAAIPADSFTLEDARHLLIRAGFGGTPEEVAKLHALGLDGMVSWLVDYEQRPEGVPPPAIIPTPVLDYRKLRTLSENERRRARRRWRIDDQRRFARVRSWWVEKLLTTRRPLEERMTLFWHNHFTSSYQRVRNAYHMLLQNELLREHATGNFAELLHEVSKDPAMLEYLDNNRNRKGRPNENFAREVMELFTLGVGHYSEKDIKEAARAFTGWTFNRGGASFVFNRRQHDFGQKTVLGRTGDLDGDDVLDALLSRPECSELIARKLFAHFAYADPPESIVKELAQELRDRGYELKPMLRRMFKSEAFYSPKARGSLVKSPIVLLVSTVRMLGINPPPPELIVAGAARLGQNLMYPPNVKGWEEGGAWITTATLLDRYNFCRALVKAGPTGPPNPRRSAIQRRGQQQQQGRGQRDARGGRQSAEARLRAMQMMARRRAQARVRNWDPGLDLVGLVARLEVSTADQIIAALGKRLLYVPLSEDREHILRAFVTGSDGTKPLALDKIVSGKLDARGRRDAESKLRELLHLLMSTPEFQLS